MKIKGVDLSTLNRIAKELGFKLDNQREVGRYIFFVLRMAEPTSKMLLKWRKRGFSGRWTAAVCYHGHREFMTRCFRYNQNAVIRTTHAAYLGLDDFLVKAPKVGDMNTGSLMQPQVYRDQCECGP